MASIGDKRNSLGLGSGSIAQMGVVESFDRHVGIGNLRMEDGSLLFFHCIVITDGTREIEIGARVCVTQRPGHRGLLEAGSVHKL